MAALRNPPASDSMVPFGHPRRLETGADLVSLIDGWYTECQKHHGEVCTKRYTPELAAHIDDLILIDVNAGCLASLPVSTPFIALSYVWGQAETTKLLRSNFEQLKRPGALHAHPDEVVIPKTIRDAMHLVRILDAKYLWVDCLSVMQDAETAEMKKMLRAMAHIYASADFTIVAAAGSDANHGLSGMVGGFVQSCHSEMTRYPWGSTWASRGWTFQESLFSRRLLIFDGSVAWICGRCVWSDKIELTPPRPKDWPAERPHLDVPLGMMSLIPKTPSLRHWGLLVEEFSSRSLTFEEDSEAAFAGAMEIVSSIFPGGLVQGLPLFFLDIILLWEPVSSLSRRHGSPSWSWKGWKGGIECLACRHPYLSGLFGEVGEPIDWIAAIRLTSLATYQIEGASRNDMKHLNGFYKYRALREQPDAQLPDGWKRHEHPAGAFYTSASEGAEKFRYSFPLPLAGSSDHSTSSITCRILTCTAPIATLTFGAEEYRRNELVLPILHHENTIGLMNLHEEPDRHDPEWKQNAHARELVAISEMKEQRNSVNLFARDDGTMLMQSICNVLWIEWKENIAYRKGKGAVRKDAWDALKPTVRTFKLG